MAWADDDNYTRLRMLDQQVRMSRDEAESRASSYVNDGLLKYLHTDLPDKRVSPKWPTENKRYKSQTNEKQKADDVTNASACDDEI
jgi:hypothetical protein